MNQFTFGDARPGGLEHIDLSTSHKVSKVRNKIVSVSFYQTLSCIQLILQYTMSCIPG